MGAEVVGGTTRHPPAYGEPATSVWEWRAPARPTPAPEGKATAEAAIEATAAESAEAAVEPAAAETASPTLGEGSRSMRDMRRQTLLRLSCG